MGLFGKHQPVNRPIKSTPFLFSYSAPYGLERTRHAIYEALWSLEQYQDEFGRPSLPQLEEPPLKATQYISVADENKLVITAGNRVETFWNVTITFAEKDGRTEGEANIDRRKVEIDTWMGSVHKIGLYLPATLQRDFSFVTRIFDQDDEWVELPTPWWEK